MQERPMLMKINAFVLPSLCIIVISLTACGTLSSQPVTALTLYTDRHYDTDQTLFDAFTFETGIQINVLKLESDPLITRLQNEGVATPADLVFLADAGRLGKAKALNLLQPIDSETIPNLIDVTYQDDDLHWIALTKRARVMVYSKARVNPSTLSTYEALATSAFEGKIVTRTSSHVYNQSLVASMIQLNGETATANWLQGLVNNFARTPSGNDRDQAKAIHAGIADIAIMNTYYLGRMLESSDVNEVAAAESVGVFFPNQSTTGTHINVSGMGLTAATKKQDAAEQFIAFLLSEPSQRAFADANFEYPVRDDVPPHTLLASWGEFNAQDVSLSSYYAYATQAYELMIQAGWN